MRTKKDLDRYACHLADQYRAGLLPEVQSTGWPVVWKGLTKELRCRCPGLLEVSYAIALNQAFVSSRHCHSCFEHDEDGAASGIDVSRVA
jgi:hypothetical protein